jgi:hypothetical protein
VVGIAFALAGAASLTTGLLHVPLPSILSLSGASFAVICGFVLLLGGLLIALFAFQRREHEVDVVPAEVAFASRMASTTPVLALATQARHVTPPRAPPAPRDARIAPLDAEIRELTRKISKAGVMLATGQISKQGYVSFVDDLKKQRGELEARRVNMEMSAKLG